MARITRWEGQDLINLLVLDIKTLQKIYGYSSDYLGTARHRKRKEIKEGKIVMPEGQPIDAPYGSEIPEGARVSWHVGYIKNAEGEIEYTKPLLSVHPSENVSSEVFEPAVAANIRPTRRKRAERLGRQLLVFGDSQIGYHRVYDSEGNDELIPTHSEEALRVITQINAHERPEFVVNVSDTVDLAEFGRFDPQSDSFHRTLGPSFQRAHDLYAQLRADNPDAELIETDSNHTARVHKNLMKKMPEMYGFTLPGEDYPLMSYYRLANLGALGVRFISGYGGAEYIHGEENGPPIVFRHGNHSSASPGATIRKEAAQNPTTHVVRGHGHSYEHIAQTTRRGEQLHYIQLGTTCDTGGNVPSYHSSIDDFGKPVKRRENWQNQALIIEDFQNGHYNFNVIDIVNGIAYYKGIRYDGNERNES